MIPFTTLRSRLIPLPRRDVDTDLIIPADFLTSTSREGYGKNLFRRLRDADPKFPLNLAKYNGAAILVADTNFGCGSSREHAVWAILDAGIKVVIAPSFADIFSSNAAKNGLLLITLAADRVHALLARCAEGAVEACVSLETEEVQIEHEAPYRFHYDPFRKHCLLHGLEDLDYLLAAKDQIATFRANQEKVRFLRVVI